MSQPPDVPSRPEDFKAWLESLSRDEIMSLASSLSGGGLARSVLGERLRPGRDTISLPDPPAQTHLLTIRVSLDHSKPPVWRRLTIPGDLRLSDVHTVLQAAMGWTDSHLHRFYLDDPWGGRYFVTDYDIEEGEDGINETDVRLDQVLRETGEKLGYAYDFGDGWTHTLRLEQAAPMPAPEPDPTDGGGTPTYRIVCLAGARACPPEDVGGIGGYQDMAAWVRHDFDPAHAPEGWDAEGLAGLREWLPPGWHPDACSVEEVNDALRLVTLEVGGAMSQLPPGLRQLARAAQAGVAPIVDEWLVAAGASGAPEFTADEATELIRPWRTVLTVVGDGLQLTSAGYLPPAIVENLFTSLDMGGEWIGKGNREDLTLPVAELREQARRFGLVRKVKGRLVPTARAKTLRDDPAALLDHILGSLPFPRDDFALLASHLTLLGIGAGMSVRDYSDVGRLADAVCRVLDSVGWQRQTGPIERLDVLRATGDTVQVLQSMTGRAGDAAAAAHLQSRLALAVLSRSGD